MGARPSFSDEIPLKEFVERFFVGFQISLWAQTVALDQTMGLFGGPVHWTKM